MPYTSATYSITKQGRSVTYYDDTGYTEVHVGGTRSWRNNNPGNLRYTNWTKNHGAIGKDGDGFAIFPDVETGNQAKGDLLRGKYGDHDSIREMLKGKYDEDGNYIPGTAYAPESDGNNPDAYADAIKKMSGIDVDNKKISELTPDEMNKLLDAMRRYEGWREGNAYCVSPDGEIQDPSYIIGNSMFGGLNPDDLRNLFGDASRTKSPLVFDLDGDGIETTSLSYGVFFDHDGNGFADINIRNQEGDITGQPHFFAVFRFRSFFGIGDADFSRKIDFHFYRSRGNMIQYTVQSQTIPGWLARNRRAPWCKSPRRLWGLDGQAVRNTMDRRCPYRSVCRTRQPISVRDPGR